ncbi:MAG: OmpH family outer membrane protein [Steroidobacteraceae bacterium]
MKRSLMLAGLGFAAALATAGVAQAEQRIAVVNFNRLMEESPQAKAVNDALSAEFGPRQKELQAQQASLKAKEERLQKDGATMSADQKTKSEKDLRDGAREFQQKAQDFQEEVNSRQNEELSKLQRMLVEESQAYAQGQKFDLVVPANAVIYFNSSLDITSGVLGALQSRAASAPKAPAPGK